MNLRIQMRQTVNAYVNDQGNPGIYAAPEKSAFTVYAPHNQADAQASIVTSKEMREDEQ